MSITTAHKILIVTATIFFLFYAAWEILGYSGPGGAWALFRGIIALIVACALALYLRYFLKSVRLR